MKNTLRITLLILATFVLLSGCSLPNGATERSKDIVLTTENASDYLTFSLRGGGSDPSVTSEGIKYASVQANGNISGISGYEYNDVTITLKFSFKIISYSHNMWGDKDTFIFDVTTDPIQLNFGGNGVVNAYEEIDRAFSFGVKERSVECLGYEIVSITGTVRPM